MPSSSDPPPFSSLSDLPLSRGGQLKYKQVELEVRKMAETLPIGSKMPPERALATTFGCSVLTVRKGIESLAAEGIIERKIGSGTFVMRRSEKHVPSNNRLGVLVYRQGDAYAYRIVRSLANAALQRSIEPRSIWIENFDQKARVQLENLRREGCSAFTIPWFPPDLADDVQGFLRETPIQVSLPQIVPGFENYCFEAPEIFGRHTEVVTEMLCAYFNLLGNEHIAFLGPDISHNPILNQQLIAYTRAMSRRQKPIICCLVPAKASAMDALAKRWEEYRGKLAIISYDDEHALRFLTAMHKIGLHAPTDFRMVGYNNTEAANYSDPPLSSVAQNFDYIAQRLIDSALALANGRIVQATEIAASILVVRDTCGGRTKLTQEIRAKLPGFTFITES